MWDAEPVLESKAHEDDPGDSEPQSALVEIEPGLAVLYGDHVPEGVDLAPFALLDQRAQRDLDGAIAKVTGLANVGAEGVNGFMQAQGLVRLAPETLKALQTAKPIVSGGWNLGTLANANGGFAASVRWLPATSAGAVSVVASMGPAIALLAIQMQLSKIEGLARHNLEISQIGLSEARRERRAAIQGNHRVIHKLVELARDHGAVTPAIYDEVRGRQSELESQVEVAKGVLEDHVQRLRSKTSNKDRRRYLEDHGEDVLATAHSLLVAQSSKFTYQAMWAGNLLDTIALDERNAMTAERVIKDGVAERDAVLAETDWLLHRTERELGVMAELDGKRTIKFSGENCAARDVTRMARQLRNTIADIRGESHPSEFVLPAVPSTTAFKKSVPEELPRILAFRLAPGERLLAMSEADFDAFSLRNFSASWIVVTTARLLVANKDAFKRHAQISKSISLDDIRYVRFVQREKGKGPGMDIVTSDQNMRLVFGDWAATGPAFDQVKRFADVLGSFMRLPQEEIPSVSIPELNAGHIASTLEQSDADRSS